VGHDGHVIGMRRVRIASLCMSHTRCIQGHTAVVDADAEAAKGDSLEETEALSQVQAECGSKSLSRMSQQIPQQDVTTRDPSELPCCHPATGTSVRDTAFAPPCHRPCHPRCRCRLPQGSLATHPLVPHFPSRSDTRESCTSNTTSTHGGKELPVAGPAGRWPPIARRPPQITSSCFWRLMPLQRLSPLRPIRG
jgi:hypothetical protein